MLRAATAVFVIGLSTGAWCQEPCRAIVPEVASDLVDAGLPRNENRWRAIGRLWAESEQGTLDDVGRMLATGSLSPAADVIQGRTHDLLREAIDEHRDDLVHSLLNLWRKPLSTLSSRNRVFIYYQTPEQRLSEATLDGTYEMWVGADGIESLLYSAIYLAGATDIVNAIARRKLESRSEEMNSFAQRLSGTALSHYKRWSLGRPGIWQVRGWGCEASGLDLVEFTQWRMNHTLGGRGETYCASPTDLDMMITVGISNLLRAAAKAPDLVAIADSDQQQLASLVRLQAKFMGSRLVYGAVVNAQGQSVPTVDFDPGAWASHPDLAYAIDESAKFPEKQMHAKAGLGWDFSHGSRIAWTALALADSSTSIDGMIDWSSVADALAHQVAYRVLDASGATPRFRNYLDGSNGWYRVDLSSGTGIPPYGLSRAFLSMPWARLSVRDSRLMAATTSLWRSLSMPSAAQCDLLDQVYIKGSFWQAREPKGSPIAGSLGNLNLFPFLATSPVR